MAKTLGMLFGIVFLAVGILGFVPGVTTNDMLLGIFMVNAAHSVVHIVSGVIFLIASMSGAGAARLWFQIFGVIYAVVAVLGFAQIFDEAALRTVAAAAILIDDRIAVHGEIAGDCGAVGGAAELR